MVSGKWFFFFALTRQFTKLNFPPEIEQFKVNSRALFTPLLDGIQYIAALRNLHFSCSPSYFFRCISLYTLTRIYIHIRHVLYIYVHVIIWKKVLGHKKYSGRFRLPMYSLFHFFFIFAHLCCKLFFTLFSDFERRCHRLLSKSNVNLCAKECNFFYAVYWEFFLSVYIF